VYPLKLDEIKLDGVFGWEFFLEYVWNEVSFEGKGNRKILVLN